MYHDRTRSTAEDEYDHLRKVAGHVHSEPDGDIRETAWRHPLTEADWVPFAWGWEPAPRYPEPDLTGEHSRT